MSVIGLLILAAATTMVSRRFYRLSLLPEVASPVTDADLFVNAVPDNDNALVWYECAYELRVESTRAEQDVIDEARKVAGSPMDPAASRWLISNRAALDMWSQGADCEEAIPDQFPFSVQHFGPPDIGGVLTLTDVCLSEANRRLSAAQPDEAWEMLRRAFRFSRHIRNNGGRIHHTAGVVIHQHACDAALNWGQHSSVSTQSLKTALSEIRREFSRQAPISRTVMIDHLGFEHLVEGKGSYSILECVHWPADSQIASLMRNTFGIEAEPSPWVMGEPELSIRRTRLAFLKAFPVVDLPFRNRPRVLPSENLYETSDSNRTPVPPATIDGVFVAIRDHDHFPAMAASYDRFLAKEVVLESALAVLIWKKGQCCFPDSLAEATQASGFEVPVDPLAPDCRPVQFVNARDHIMIYSVGLNHCDDGGKSTPDVDWSAADIGYRLGR